ncbi:MAG: SDR family oxidoreductase [Myxococcales bacterium]|nr:SDR family NAD(P)-dependent oxidoreductase [Myxococcales bacterium]HIK85330.1 SDR family NAD(P)-dependent oxidoreductase [Myxococcales bacterium]
MSGICSGRVVIVTGSGGGLGREHALAFAREGASVLVNDLGVTNHGEGGGAGPAETVAREIQASGGEAIANTESVADFAAGRRMVEQAMDHFGRLDVVVNNAGFLRDRMFVSTSEDEWDAVINVHLKGHFCVTRHACEVWRKQSKAGESVDARIINTSSGAGLQGSVGQSTYSTAKAGIAALTLVQAAELGRYGITSNAIAPAARTRMTEAIFSDMAKPEDGAFDENDPANVSPLVVWLGSPLSRDITGRIFEVKGGLLGVSDGWRDGPTFDKHAKWAPDEIGATLAELVDKAPAAQKVYGS